MKFLSGEKKLPSKSGMYSDMHIQMQLHYGKGYSKRLTHYLGPGQKEYHRRLSEIAEIENIPDVMAGMHFDSVAFSRKAPSEFRKYKYTIIDDKTFIKEKYED